MVFIFYRLAANCSKLLDELRIGNIPPRTHIPPPGFSNTANHMNAFGLGIPRTGEIIFFFFTEYSNTFLFRLQLYSIDKFFITSGNKIVPFTQQTLTAFQQHTAPAGECLLLVVVKVAVVVVVIKVRNLSPTWNAATEK